MTRAASEPRKRSLALLFSLFISSPTSGAQPSPAPPGIYPSGMLLLGKAVYPAWVVFLLRVQLVDPINKLGNQMSGGGLQSLVLQYAVLLYQQMGNPSLILNIPTRPVSLPNHLFRINRPGLATLLYA